MKEKNTKMLVEKAVALLVDIYSNADEDGDRLLEAINILGEALKNLAKSAWIAVEDELPELGENVLVCNKENPADMWFCHRADPKETITDKHGFASRMAWEEITHWRRIDKLEKENCVQNHHDGPDSQ